MCYKPQKYIKKLISDYLQMFGKKPEQYTSLLENGDHPDIGLLPELEEIGTRQYQSIMGSL